jgi:hypothetical protein
MSHSGVQDKISRLIFGALKEDKSTGTKMLPIAMMNGVLAKAYEDMHTVAPVIFIVNAGRHSSGYTWKIEGKRWLYCVCFSLFFLKSPF